jgi:amino-acid N-acetyltransferase
LLSTAFTQTVVTNNKMTMSWSIRKAEPHDEASARALLESCGLSAIGLEEQYDGGYVVAEREGAVVGMAGVEVHGAHGLLRSVAVMPVLRGSGLGAALVHDRIRWTRENGLESLYLLTTTAAEFFARHGFEIASRDDAPREIHSSKEFSEMCPSSAVCMKLSRGGVR